MPQDRSRRVSARLRELRRNQGLTQDELAAKAGVSQSTVSIAEHRASGVSPETLGKLAAVLGTDLGALLAEGGAP